MKKFVLAVMVLFLLTGAAFAAEPVRIGVYLPLTGQNAFGGQLELEGVQLAHQEFPEVLGRKVELFVVDNKSDRVESANAVQRLIEYDNVVAIIGTYGSSLAMAGGEVAERAGIPVMGTSCTNPLVTEGKDFYFRACFIDPFQGLAAAYYSFNTLGFKNAAILTDVGNDYSVGLAGFFKRSYEALGGTIVSEMRYQTGDQDFTAQLTEIISKNPDIVFLPSYFAEGAIVLKQARELGGTFPFMGGDAMDNPEIVTLGGDAVEGFMHTTFAYDPTMSNMSAVAQHFTNAWRVFKPDKDPNVNSALGYDSYLLILDAIKRAGSTDPKAIRDALAVTKDFPAVTGITTLNPTGDAEKEVGIVKIVNGQRTFAGLINPTQPE